MNNSFNSYISRNSYIHSLNPSLKIIIMILFIVLVFLPLGFFGQLILLTTILTGWYISKLPRRLMQSIIKACIVMFFFLLLINWIAMKTPGFNIFSSSHVLWDVGLFNKNVPLNPNAFWSTGYLLGGNFGYYDANGTWETSFHAHIIYDAELNLQIPDGFTQINYSFEGHSYFVLYQSHWYTLSTQSIFFSLYITLKIYLVIVIITLAISSTTPVQLSFAIEDILHPLRYIKVPVNEWAMTISIALRFVPSLLQEAQKVMNAQASRGVDFTNGNFKDKAKSLVALVVPMFSIAFYKADDLANAMEARSYNPRYARSRYRDFKIKVWHWIVLGFVAVGFGIGVVFSIKKVVLGCFGFPESLMVIGG